jgi:hypothetical protein
MAVGSKSKTPSCGSKDGGICWETCGLAPVGHECNTAVKRWGARRWKGGERGQTNQVEASKWLVVDALAEALLSRCIEQ